MARDRNGIEDHTPTPDYDRSLAWIARELGDVTPRLITPSMIVASLPNPRGYSPPIDDATIGAGYGHGVLPDLHDAYRSTIGGIGYGVRGMPAGEYLGVDGDA